MGPTNLSRRPYGREDELPIDPSIARLGSEYAPANGHGQHYDLPIDPLIAHNIRSTYNHSPDSPHAAGNWHPAMASHPYSHYMIQPGQATSLLREPNPSILQNHRQLHPPPLPFSRLLDTPSIPHNRHPYAGVDIDQSLNNGLPLSFDDLHNHNSRQVEPRGTPQQRQSHLNGHGPAGYADAAAGEPTSSRPSATPSQTQYYAAPPQGRYPMTGHQHVGEECVRYRELLAPSRPDLPFLYAYPPPRPRPQPQPQSYTREMQHAQDQSMVSQQQALPSASGRIATQREIHEVLAHLAHIRQQ
jgi:hypothetical protein